MTDSPDIPPVNGAADDGPDIKGMIVSACFVAIAAMAWYLDWELTFLIASGAVISVIIWQACDPFAEAAQWLGRRLHIPGSVRGATLDAVASSMPELFSGIFFVIVAIQLGRGSGPEGLAAAGAEGFGSTIATCAGSAVYNMILIPAVVALVVSFRRPEHPVVEVESEVLSRDGMWFLGCEVVLLACLYQSQMYWWMGVGFIGLYAVYISQLVFDARRHRRKIVLIDAMWRERGGKVTAGEIQQYLRTHGRKASLLTINHRIAQLKGEEDEDGDSAPDSAPVFFSVFSIPINGLTCALILTLSTVVAASACYGLVQVTRDMAETLNVPTFFVAVILAAAVSSVPDTFLSVGAAMRGDDSGAVSNAFGSNIFDICICISIPLLVNAYLNDWEPVTLLQDGEAIPGLTGLRVLLWVLTAITLAILWHKHQLTRFKAFLLIGLYAIFIGYAITGSLGILKL